MRISRRSFIFTVLQPAWLALAGSLSACANRLRSVSGSEALIQNIETLRSRDYGETGVSMVLVGEDIRRDVTRSADLGGIRLAERLRRYAQLFEQARPEAGEGDVAALVEVIAHEDFLGRDEER